MFGPKGSTAMVKSEQRVLFFVELHLEELFENDLAKLIASILVCQLAAVASGYFAAPIVGYWYGGITNPDSASAIWVLGIVWAFLYLLIGIALYLAWKRIERPGAGRAIEFFAIQLGLNVVWAIAFFGLKSPVAGLASILLLWVALELTIVEFWKLNQWASALLVPHLAWVSLAAYLNYSVWKLNG